MNKIKYLVVLVFGLVALTACGSTKTESVIYELKDAPGTTSTITFEYDKDKNIQKATTQSEVDFEESGLTKEYFEEMNKSADSIYEAMDGVVHTSDIKDDTMTETLEITVKDVSKESLPVLFMTAAKDGKVSLDEYSKNLESIGYTKK